ncbi:MAG: UDP-N-acetylmuramate--L-alanine ligase [Firmicutes bacterium]|nr:UDP-N-acetylmuramate--L-alanine ligase [Bacillota bacterium]
MTRVLCPERHIHFVGIGGAGMSAIAKVLLELGYTISGSDLKPSNTTERLKDMGAAIHIGHRRENLNCPDLLVVSSAIPEDNVEVVAATGLGIPVLQRGEMLAQLMNMKEGIAVAGSHGKTTTTSMISLLLEKNGLDPTVLIGGELNDIGGNAKLGSGDYLVAEADESDGSFLRLNPKIAVVTNIENEHLDYYGSEEKIVDAFATFLAAVKDDGFAVLCADGHYMNNIIAATKAPTITYAVRKQDADLWARDITFSRMGSKCNIYGRNGKLGKLLLNVPGEYNIANSLAAVAIGLELGLPFSQIAGALETFGGVHRRFELVGEVNGVSIVDDYGHHPTEIAATLQAAKEGNFNRIIAVFQPHRYTRTKYLYKEFGKAFAAADEVIVTDIYPAGEKPIPGITGALIAQSIGEEDHKKVTFMKNLASVPLYLKERVREGDLVLTLGAGDVWKMGKVLVKNLLE